MIPPHFASGILAPALLACLLSGPLAADEGFEPLFNGKDLRGWLLVYKNSGKGCYAEDGKIVFPPDGGGNLLTIQEYANFIFRFEFRFEPGGNNGVGIRAPLSGDVAYTGMEIQILDHDHEKYRGWLKPWQRNGSVYDVFPPRADALKPAGEWNEEEITADGSRITVKLNGTLITEADLSSVTDPQVLKKHPGLRRTAGHIGFLGHGSLIELRNLRIKVLP